MSLIETGQDPGWTRPTPANGKFNGANCENLLLKRGSKGPGQRCHVVAIDFVIVRRDDWLPPSVPGSSPHTEARLVQLFQ